jgi:NADH-quinone oxidoreductase subunit J
MTHPQPILWLATLLGALGMWLMLPRGTARGRMLGAVLAAVALGLWASQLPGLGDWVAGGLFYVLAGVTVVAAAAAITFRNPVYCAIWFGLSLLGTAGLFLLVGAQFLAVATVVVYAGAILVTFLFVLMLAQPRGRASYDRVSWEALVSSAIGAGLVGLLSLTLVSVCGSLQAGADAVAVAKEQALAAGVLAPDHVARIGAELFGRHLIAVEVAGTLLLAALVGAAVIAGRDDGIHEEHEGHEEGGAL